MKITLLLLQTLFISISYGQSLKHGEKVPAIEKEGYLGEIVRLSDVNSKVIVLDFWASWCRPCLESVESTLKPLYTSYPRESLEIIGISNDQQQGKWESAIENWGMNWLQVWDDDRRIVRDFGVRAIPTYFIVDNEGKLIEGYVYSRDLKKKIKKALKAID